jgi:hypothetical protein
MQDCKFSSTHEYEKFVKIMSVLNILGGHKELYKNDINIKTSPDARC